ncbi:hypothetical protein AX16_000011 [Volvariella volvacea WC 439]|nr:hypothetical protein AX16_000011 [Volvariella volvacea WC 439]
MPKRSQMTLAEAIASFKATLATSKHIIAVAGAGLSAASGIPTFRGAGGLWRKYDAISLATPEAFQENPALVWQFYHYRREAALKAKPNAAHLALAQFSVASIRHAIAPGSTFTLITQNVDGLSRIAMDTIQAQLGLSSNSEEQPQILEMHGRLFDLKCSNDSCGHTVFDRNSPVCQSLAGTEALTGEGVMDAEIPLDKLPRCSQCGALARPGVVWFGEIPWHLDQIDDLVEKADLCIVVGTSSKVYPAAGYAAEVKQRGGKVATFNVERTPGDSISDFVFHGPCEELLPEALGMSIASGVRDE